MNIPDAKIEEIRAAADIVDVVSGFVRLKRVGKNFVGLCPFHQEKTPSFNVNVERGIYKCFGCGRGGNVFTFLMEYEKISFVEAARDMAERCGITIAQESPKQQQSREALDALYEAMRIAARLYFDTLQSVQGTPGAEYFQKRRWNEQTQRRFGLGFAPDAWDSFLQHARDQQLNEDVLEQAGLIVRKESGHAYDRFRNRLIFPIFSTTKKVIGFGARALRPEDEPKYLNSPETPIYNKSRVLYGLSHAVPAIRDKDAVILVEGYADVITLHQAGIEHAVATSGTALTSDQVRLLARYTKNPFFLFDADSAGFNAMVRGLEIILEQDCDPRIVLLPAGEDPDSYVQKHGSAALLKRVDEARSLVDFISERYKREGKLDHPEGKTEAIRHIVGLIARMDDPIKRNMYVHHVAEQYGVYENVLFSELEKARRKLRRTDFVHGDTPSAPAADQPNAPPPTQRHEKAFLSLLLTSDEEVRGEVLRYIHVDYVQDKRLRYLLHLVLEQHEHEGHINISALESHLADDLTMHGVLADLLMGMTSVSERWSEIQTVNLVDQVQVLFDAYRKLVLMKLAGQRQDLQLRMRTTHGDIEGSMQLAQQLQGVLEAQKAIERSSAFSHLMEVEHEHQHVFLSEGKAA